MSNSAQASGPFKASLPDSRAPSATSGSHRPRPTGGRRAPRMSARSVSRALHPVVKLEEKSNHTANAVTNTIAGIVHNHVYGTPHPKQQLGLILTPVGHVAVIPPSVASGACGLHHGPCSDHHASVATHGFNHAVTMEQVVTEQQQQQQQ